MIKLTELQELSERFVKFDSDSKIKILDFPSVIHESRDSEKYQELWDKLFKHRSTKIQGTCLLCDRVEKEEI